MTTYLTAVPAYGRDYKSKAAVLKDWDEGKDFLLQSFDQSGYISIRDALPAGTQLSLRYDKLQKIVQVPKPKTS